jgi:aspartate aminotransferase
MAALDVALRTAARVDGEVVIPTPCWLDYPLYVRHLGLEPKLVELMPPNFALDSESVAAALSPRTCAVLLSHPANPTGRSYRARELSALGAALKVAESKLGCRPTLIADEHIATSSLRRATSALRPSSIVPSSSTPSGSTTSSKVSVSGTPPCRRDPERGNTSPEMVRWTRITGLSTPTALMQRALGRLLSIRYEQSWLDQWRRRFFDDLTGAGYAVVPADGTLFLYVQTPDAADDFAFIEELVSRGVLALPAPVFHHSGYFRISLTGSEAMLDRALAALTTMPVR